MNKYEHSAQSANIFGGKASDYETFHSLIDSNKTVTPSIFGRFFLHHIDVGLVILEHVFGKHIGPKKVPAKKLLIQHLLEDYDQILTFKEHWLPALKSKEILLPKPDDWDSFVYRAAKDPRVEKLNLINLKELEDFFRLKTLLPKDSLCDKNIVFAIFAHALGGDLLAKIIGEKFHDLWTNDVVAGYLNCRFKFEERDRDLVPTLLDYEKYVPDLPWMHTPPGNEAKRLDPKRIKRMIDEYESGEKKEAKPIVIPKHLHQTSYRKPCNLD